MRTAALFCALALFVATGVSGRELQQLPTLTSMASPSPAPSAYAPAPSPIGPVSCALEYLVNAGNYNTLIELVESASQSAALAQILDSAASHVTLIAPTDSGIEKALASANLTAEFLLGQPVLITDVLTYHVLPSQIQASDLVDGYSFNTELKTDGIAQSVAVTGNGATATFVGAKASAGSISGPIIVACNITIIPIDGLLLPSS